MLPVKNKPVQTKESKRILIATIGSLGDLHPCLTLAVELRRRGHQVEISSTPYYRPRVESLGIAFRRLRPDWDPTDQNVIRKCEDIKKGPEVLYRRMLLPELRNTYQDLLSAASHADLMVTGELVYASPLVAEKLGLRWVSLILSPFSFFSSYDPSFMVNVPNLIHLRKFGASAYRMGLNLGRLLTRHWSQPVRALRRAEGLRPKCDPVFRDKFSPNLVLALFSRCLAQPQRDWPKQTIQPGFLFFEDKNRDTNLPQGLSNFLERGEPPIVFTQGSTAVHNPGHFYEISAAAAKLLQRRAILIGTGPVPPMAAPDILTVQYAAYSQVFPRASVNVHQGGSGTTGEALRSGRPMLIVPYGWDQPDNASRVQRLGAGLHVARKDYTVANAAQALGKLLQMPSFSDCAAEVRTRLAAENGLTTACTAIESVL